MKLRDEEFPLGSVSRSDSALRFPRVPVLQRETARRSALEWETFFSALILPPDLGLEMESASSFSLSAKLRAKDLAWPSLSSVFDVFAMELASVLARETF